MNTNSLLISCIAVALLSGCSATIALTKVPPDPAKSVEVKDVRAPDEKIYRRDGVRDPIQYFGDADFDSPPLSQFSALLSSKLPAGSYNLEVSKFRVIDIFPKRLGAATAGALTGVLGSMGYAVYVQEASSLTQDNITCLIAGSLQGKPVSASVSVPYKISPLAGMVKNDPAFKGAVNECLSILSEKIASKI